MPALNNVDNRASGKLWGGVRPVDRSPSGRQGVPPLPTVLSAFTPHWASELERVFWVDVGGLKYGLIVGKSNGYAETDP